MNHLEKIYEGLTIEIIVHQGEYKGRYRTKVEEVGERIISIGVPVADGQFVPLREGTELELVFADNVCAYSFTSIIVRRIGVPIPTFIIEAPQQIHKIQRRKYVRVPIIQAVKIQVLEKEGLSAEKNGYMINLSGGGLQGKTSFPIPHNSIIIIKTKIGDSEMAIPSIVIRCDREDEKESYVFSAQFHEIPEKVRDKIINQVFEIQREMRKKGLV